MDFVLGKKQETLSKISRPKGLDKLQAVEGLHVKSETLSLNTISPKNKRQFKNLASSVFLKLSIEINTNQS
jgi:hypothetical protein